MWQKQLLIQDRPDAGWQAHTSCSVCCCFLAVHMLEMLPSAQHCTCGISLPSSDAAELVTPAFTHHTFIADLYAMLLCN